MNNDLDIKKTKKNSSDLLRTYRSLKRIGTQSETVNEIESAVNKCDQLEKEIITKKFLIGYPGTTITLYTKMYMSESKFYRRLESALIQFAEAYNGGELLVHKDGHAKEVRT
ncbi:hypothetical protein [Enterococcus rotai]|uniref:hypothetical protein n=1 Tax=Enterococcus rotai TaxID=118060 RepID=UPI0032B5AE8C